MRWIESRRRLLRACIEIGLLLPPLLANGQGPSQPGKTQSSLPAVAPSPAIPASPPARVQPHFLVVLDAAHGGDDDGARLGNQLREKDLVLTLSIHLRSILNARGISVVTTRESDTTIPANTRAEVANHVMAAACITLHATGSGSGIHLFTSSLTPIALTRFMPWETAQGGYTEQSLRLSSEINSAMTRAGIPVTLGRTALQPLDSFTCPAVAVEVAPGSANGLADPTYQNQLVETLAAALEQWQHDWKQQP